MKNKIKILIVEDDLFTAEDIETQLKTMGFTHIDIALTYKKALKLIESKNFDLILLDVELDQRNSGIDIAYNKKVFHKVPIIYITGCQESHIKEELRLSNPESCLLKPINDAQLEMTIFRVLSLKLNEKSVIVPLDHGFSYELKNRTLSLANQNIKLTPNERCLLERLIAAKGKVVASEELEFAVWAYKTPRENSLRMLIRSLKKKLNSEMIVNERSIGYKLC